ncbi:methyltransferase domain-containing protein [Solwaraspora sp. WMMD406]|uniref:class I SAM-dependent DNA methyltransferase n=1 Tax=Solwaraspora sp. WMMD406 TaxID=3016095 RepID=UPI0024169ED9|nr:class I SAM-dependent methyltransferase [Solwaraspora sp. WMMD406]MDG4765250.1 methyltransferase domain-containing protein [Solwaraspora sp. WMMD406]
MTAPLDTPTPAREPADTCDASEAAREPYDALAAVYDRWTVANDYPGWAAFVDARIPAASRVLDVCCGTGTMAELLLAAGHRVSGIDRSAAMLRQARRRLPVGTPLRQADLAGPVRVDGAGFADAGFDAAVCCFDSVNYFRTDEAIGNLFAFVSASLRPGGWFVFDVNTRRKLEDVFGSSHYGDDAGDFAYVWRNRYSAQRRSCEFAISLFVADRPDGGFTRHTESHEQRWFDQSELRGFAAAAGFTVDAVTDDYGEGLPTEQTLRESWVLRRGDG